VTYVIFGQGGNLPLTDKPGGHLIPGGGGPGPQIQVEKFDIEWPALANTDEEKPEFTSRLGLAAISISIVIFSFFLDWCSNGH
jgi:hypothetical protein